MKARSWKRQGFSLVETAMALGLIGFCLVALLGLIPSGLQFIQETQKRAEAVRLLKLMATGLQAAHQVPDSADWQMLGLKADSRIRWTADGGTLAPIHGWVKVSGMPVTQPQQGDFAYVIDLTAMDANQPASYARAMLRVAWPATAEWTQGFWTEDHWTEGRWAQAQGSEEALVLFRPR